MVGIVLSVIGILLSLYGVVLMYIFQSKKNRSRQTVSWRIASEATILLVVVKQGYIVYISLM